MIIKVNNPVSDKNLIDKDQPLQSAINPSKKELPDEGDLSYSYHVHHMQQDIQKYLEMQKVGPDWEFAQKHGASTMPGKVSSQAARQQCICCLRDIIKQPIGLCQNSNYGFPLYFIFIKYSMAILLLEIVNYTSIQLYWSISANLDFCQNDIPRGQTHCTGWMVFLSNISQVLSTDQHIIRLTSFATLLLVLIYVRDQFTKIWLYYDQRQPTYSNFSIFIENIPKKMNMKDHFQTIGQRIRSFFAQQEIFPSKPKIAKIHLIGQFQTLYELQQSRKQLAHQLQDYAQKDQELRLKIQSTKSMNTQISDQLIRDKKAIKEKRQDIQSLAKAKNNQLNDQKLRLKQLIQKEDLDCDKAIICFEHQIEKEQAMEQFQAMTNTQLLRYFQSTKVKVRSGPQPHQIIWENINVSRSVQRKRIIISWVIFLAILASVTVGFYYLLNFKSYQIVNASEKVGQAIDYSSLIAIILFNKFIFAYIIHHLVEFEKQKTGQSFQFSLMLKYSLGLFFTTAFMTILVQGVTHHNVFSQQYGIVEEQTIMFFFTAFLVPLIWFVNPQYLWKLLQRKLHQKSPFMTQQEANKLMENPEYLMGKRYGQVLKSVWFTFLYSCVVPFGSILIFIGTALYYWIDKYNLLRKSSILQGVSGNLCMKALFLMDFVLVLKPAGQLIFDGLIRHQWNVIPIVQISIGTVYLLLPMTKLLQYFHPQYFTKAAESYQELTKKKFSGYELFNPLTKQQQLKAHFQKIEDCSEQHHTHQEHLSQPKININGRKKERIHSIIRPHSKKKNQQQSYSQYKTESKA